jgi:HD-like signal output (HDOD) protein
MQILGANHEQFGAALCKVWKFPSSFAYVTGYHHHPWDLPENNRTLAGLVYVADIINAQLNVGFTRGVEHDTINHEICAQIKLTDAMIQEVTEQLPETTEEIKSLFTDMV